MRAKIIICTYTQSYRVV